jgi:hypothetical protein
METPEEARYLRENREQFAYWLVLKTPAEAVWWEKTLHSFAALVADGPNMETLAVLGALGKRAVNAHWTGLAFQWKFVPGAKIKGFPAEYTVLYLYDKVYPGVEQVQVFLRAYLQTFNVKGYSILHWAVTCAQPLVDSFGLNVAVYGDAALITATDIIFANNHNWPNTLQHVEEALELLRAGGYQKLPSVDTIQERYRESFKGKE